MKQKNKNTGKWRGVIVATGFLFAATALFGQAHGVPASVTSLAPGHGFNNPPGVPASVLSPGPRGFGPNIGAGDRTGRGRRFSQQQGDRRGHGRFNQNFPIAVPIYSYPYGYYDDSMDTSSYTDEQAQQLNAQQQQQLNTQQQQLDALQASMQQQPMQQSPQIIVIDNRGVHNATPDERASLGKPAASAVQPGAPVQAVEPQDNGPTSVIVFLDGKRIEIQNYVIMGKELIDLTDGRIHRYQLSDLNVPETIKENNGRGMDFKLPRT
ncbi:MAG: hypothetical protein JWO13_231 [Acidobacteriales bacterium]|nr:hypothetical protein [Terriglobales bacterium]